MLGTLGCTRWSCWLPRPVAAAESCLRSQWSDFDLKATSEITVSKSLEQTKAGLRVKSTKSEEPRRFCRPRVGARGPACAPRKSRQRDRQLFGERYNDHNLIFCQPGGAYYSPDRLGARVVELMRKVGLAGREPPFAPAFARKHPAQQRRAGGRRFPAPGARRPEHHAFDLQPRAAGRHSGGGENLE